jgi:hypothetical protein
MGMGFDDRQCWSHIKLGSAAAIKEMEEAMMKMPMPKRSRMRMDVEEEECIFVL